MLILVFILVFAYLFLRFNDKKNEDNSIRSLRNISPEEAIQEVESCILNKDHRAAQEFATKYLEMDPGFNDLRRLLVRSLIETKKEYEAITHLLVLVNDNPAEVKLHLQLAVLYQNTRQYKRAIQYYNNVIKEDSSNLMATRNLASLYMYERQFDSALKTYKQLVNAITEEKDKLEIYIAMGDIYMNQGENKLAMDNYRKALYINENNTSLLKKIRKLYTRLKDTNGIIRISKQLIELEPQKYEYYKDLIELYFEIKKYDLALEYANKAMNLPKKDEASLKALIARIYTYTGKASQAVKLIKEEMNYDRNDIELVKTLAMAHCKDKKYKRAVEVCMDAIEAAQPAAVPRLQNIISTILAEEGVYLFELGQTAEAFEKFSEALQYNSDNPEVYYKLASTNRTVKNYSEAIKNCKRAIDLSPENSSYYEYLGDIYTDLQNQIEAKKQYKEAVYIDPRNASAHTKYGIIQAHDKEYPAAIKSLTTAVSIDETNPDIRYNLALIYELAGKTDLARQEYKKVLAMDPNHKEAKNNLQILGTDE